MALDVLFIGGTGQISLPCVELAVKAGHKVSVFNRGIRDEKLPRKVKVTRRRSAFANIYDWPPTRCQIAEMGLTEQGTTS